MMVADQSFLLLIFRYSVKTIHRFRVLYLIHVFLNFDHSVQNLPLYFQLLKGSKKSLVRIKCKMQKIKGAN